MSISTSVLGGRVVDKEKKHQMRTCFNTQYQGGNGKQREREQANKEIVFIIYFLPPFPLSSSNVLQPTVGKYLFLLLLLLFQQIRLTDPTPLFLPLPYLEFQAGWQIEGEEKGKWKELLEMVSIFPLSSSCVRCSHPELLRFRAAFPTPSHFMQFLFFLTCSSVSSSLAE